MSNKQYTFYCLAGHHNNDSGAVGTIGQKEADYTKVWRDKIANAVHDLCPEINIVKDDDNDTLSKVISKIRPVIKSNDLLMEVHLNSAELIATGTESFVSDHASMRSRQIGAKVSRVASETLSVPNRGCKTESESHRGKLGILSMRGAAVLWEAVFINNNEDLKKQDKSMDLTAKSIARIVVEDYKTQTK